MVEDEMVRWHHRLNPGDSEGQGNRVCCSPWVAKSQIQLSDLTATTK